MVEGFIFAFCWGIHVKVRFAGGSSLLFSGVLQVFWGYSFCVEKIGVSDFDCESACN